MGLVTCGCVESIRLPSSPENVPFQPEIEPGGRTLREKWLSRDMAVLLLCRALSPELVPGEAELLEVINNGSVVQEEACVSSVCCSSPLPFHRAAKASCLFSAGFWSALLCVTDAGVQVWVHQQVRVTHVTCASLEKIFLHFSAIGCFSVWGKNCVSLMIKSKSSALASMP